MSGFVPSICWALPGTDHDYEDLFSHSAEFEVSGLLLRVLDLETLIKVKEEIGFERIKPYFPFFAARFRKSFVKNDGFALTGHFE